MPTLQSRFPLSPRKFWKKMLGKIVSWLVILVLLEALPVLMASISSDPGSDAGSPVAWFQIVTAIAVVIIGGLFLYAWYVKTYIRRYYYDMSDQFITIKKGVFAPAEIHVQFQKIQDVYVDQDIIDRMMGLYDVHIASATIASGMEAHIDGVEFAAAEGLKQLLLDRIAHGAPSQNSNPTNAAANTSAPQAQVAPVVPPGISSSTYPVTGRWVFMRVLGGIITALFAIVLLDVYVFAPGKNSTGSLADSFGIGGIAFQVNIAIFVVVFLWHALATVLWRSYFSFEFAPEYIIMHSGILSRQEKHLPYRVIQDVSVKQSVFGRMFGVADVTIENAASNTVMVRGRAVSTGGGMTIPGLALSNAQRLSEVARGILQGSDSRRTGL